ncbi:2-oxoglutarate dehydrogenase E1 component [Terribacillus halophilus]|uniref:2-oxoglutarate dehydrogenase E1 component n=1 Tax=Terribacillus halophilus TaxID=361279 RepID=UPI0009849CDA|nr:2-oxoglutarate dehydrogenase E1 component [Terribacillus halophilus]
MGQKESSERFWENFHGPNMGYVEEQYDKYRQNPESVEASLKELFETHGEPRLMQRQGEDAPSAQSAHAPIKKITAAIQLVEAIRRYGHLEADIYPVGGDNGESSVLTKMEDFDLTESDLRDIPANFVWEEAPGNVHTALDAVQLLKERYAGTTSFEYDHVGNHDERKWLQEQIETASYVPRWSDDDKKAILKRLTDVEGFESFLSRTFVGQKRFSIEGVESMVPMLDEIIKEACLADTDNVMLGMAHRGRLSVLAHVLGKPFDLIFSEFNHTGEKALLPSEGSKGLHGGWAGDVKYHFGAVTEHHEGQEKHTTVTLANNPSHLEFVNPVVEGFTRAVQDDTSKPGYPDQDPSKALSILIHGDAAFIGEGIVAETLNLGDLPGYSTAGTVHIIANNQVGFTTNRRDGRSTRYASDLAKGFEIPIVHVNADDPLACSAAALLAFQYRQRFHKDFLIDLVGYRRYGHNEMDEPRSTQPILYQDIDAHDTVAKIFAANLEKEKVISDQEGYDTLSAQVGDHLKEIFQNMKEEEMKEKMPKDEPEALRCDLPQMQTSVPADTLFSLNRQLQKRPEGFQVFKKLTKIISKRHQAFEEEGKADWAVGEILAYASILQEGTPIRLTGQDSERGTFAHRHMVLHDVETDATYSPLHGLEDAKSFALHNSPLSEAGVIGFEYGYSVQNPDAFVLWEAQFGDFANTGQVLFDQFIAAGRAKWGEASNMAMLLPHGYEGQGPEHSSGRVERFLQLAAENNLIIANVTSSAQLFHLLRRQAKLGGREEARPLVLMTPKSLMRSARLASKLEEFTEGSFSSIRVQPNNEATSETAKTLVLGSGKVMVDIEEAMEKEAGAFEALHIARVEQLYPFPAQKIKQILADYPSIREVKWVQEEPRNMGAWTFVRDRIEAILAEDQTLEYIGRPDRASPAVGKPDIHKTEQKQIINQALKLSKGGVSV